MNSIRCPEPARAGFRICGRCKYELFPREARPSLGRNAHRGKNTHSVHSVELSPEGERIRAKKERKRASRRYMTRTTVKLVLSGLAALPSHDRAGDDEECPHCLKLNRGAA